MKVISIFLFLAYGFASCQNANGQTSAEAKPETPFDVHAETMAEPLAAKTAVNVRVGNQCVAACFDRCDTQITLNYCGQAVIERPGKDPEVYAAQVFQLQPGEWLADLGAGQYVKVYAESGTCQMDVGGEFQVLIPAR